MLGLLQNKFYTKTFIVVTFFIFCLSYINAQKDFKGRVIDAKTNEPIPFVNIGIIEEGVGTVSDEEGLFHL